MTLALIHLSDLHIRDQEASFITNAKSLVQAVSSPQCSITDALVIVTGDIASSGLSNQYDLAKQLFSQIEQGLQEKGIKSHFIIIPGNHDCDFSQENAVRRSLLGLIHKDNASFHQDFIQSCCLPQKAFFDFTKTYHSLEIAANPLSYLYRKVIINIDPYHLDLHLFNTAWCSSKEEKPGSIIMPHEVLQSVSSGENSNLGISILHHSLNWFEPDNARQVRQTLESVSDFMLTGHEHVTALRTHKDLLNNLKTIVCEGDVLGDSSGLNVTGFNIIYLDLKKKKYSWDRLKWRGSQYESLHGTLEWLDLDSTVQRASSCFFIATDFASLLRDPGATFRHPRVSPLTLDDIYIPPELRELSSNVSENSSQNKRISANEISFLLDETNHFIVTGTSLSGKTTLCYQKFKELHAKGFIPIYIDATGIKSKSLDKFQRIEEKFYAKQYQNPNVNTLRQVDESRKVIILDNFHRVRLNLRAKQLLLSEICQKYRHVLITADIFFTIEEFTEDVDDGTVRIAHLNQFELLPFGHILRSDLVTRWIQLGQEDIISYQDLAHELDDLKLTLDTILGNNLVPSYPLFLLIILQRCEDETPRDIQSSAYGFYYEYLIIQSLKEINKKNEEIDAYYSYITELANYLFENHLRTISEQSLKEFHKRHCVEYRIDPDFTRIISDLIKAQILIDIGGDYRFRYVYVYYFFVAKHLANNMTLPIIRSRVKKMCQRIYYEEFSNIILFLTHFSKDPYILDQVLQSAQSVFHGEEPQHFNEPIKEIENLISKIPELVLESRSVKEERKKSLKDRDRKESSNPKSAETLPDDDYDLDAEIKDPESIEHFTMSFKTIQILGQILKNYYGSLKADPKSTLAEELYMIALRAVNRFYSKLYKNIDSLASRITFMVNEKKVSDKEIVKNFTNKFLFAISVAIPKIYIQEVTRSVATKNLSGTFSDVLNKNNSRGVRLLDLAIKMAFKRSFPMNEATALLKDFDGDFLGTFLVKDLVIQHLYLVPRSIQERQSICDRLKIPIETRQKIALESKK